MKHKTELGSLHTAKLTMETDDGRIAELSVVTNVCHHKDFKPYDKVLVKGHGKSNITIWIPMVYSFFDADSNSHVLTNCMTINDNDIIPFDEALACKPVENKGEKQKWT